MPCTVKYPVLGLFFLSTILPVYASTITIATGTNTSLTSAQAIASPNLVLQQAAPNYTLQTAQQVSPQYYAADVLGAVNTTTQEFFSIPASSGQFIDLQVASTGGPVQPGQLMLFTPAGDEVAVASGNQANGAATRLTFVASSSGNWTAVVSGSPLANSATGLFQYDLRVASPIMYSTDVTGVLDNHNHPGFYGVSANVGDALHFSATSLGPAGASNELLLYTPNGDLVAIADANGATALSSVIDFAATSTGTWFIEVAGDPNVSPATDLFHYDLNIQGATGLGMVNPLALTNVPEPEYEAAVGAVFALLLIAWTRRRSLHLAQRPPACENG